MTTIESTNQDMYQTIADDANITIIEKQFGRTTAQDITEALDEYKRLFSAGIASDAEIATLARAYPDNIPYQKAMANIQQEPVVVGGPASVELIDREGHLITTDALKNAFAKYMSNFRTRNTMVLHSDVQVGWALPAYITKTGQVFKSGVDEKGLFFVTEIRNDTKISKKVLEQIDDGKLKSYSIAGSATKTQQMEKGLMPYMQVDDMELAEITVCEKGVNQGAKFDILKGTDAVTHTCTDGSCVMDHVEPKEPLDLVLKEDGNINFGETFKSWLAKENKKLEKVIPFAAPIIGGIAGAAAGKVARGIMGKDNDISSDKLASGQQAAFDEVERDYNKKIEKVLPLLGAAKKLLGKNTDLQKIFPMGDAAGYGGKRWRAPDSGPVSGGGRKKRSDAGQKRGPRAFSKPGYSGYSPKEKQQYRREIGYHPEHPYEVHEREEQARRWARHAPDHEEKMQKSLSLLVKFLEKTHHEPFVGSKIAPKEFSEHQLDQGAPDQKEGDSAAAFTLQEEGTEVVFQKDNETENWVEESTEVIQTEKDAELIIADAPSTPSMGWFDMLKEEIKADVLTDIEMTKSYPDWHQDKEAYSEHRAIIKNKIMEGYK